MLTFHWYGLLIGLAVAWGWFVLERRLDSARHASLARAIPVIILCSILGARLYHLLTDMALYEGRSFFSWFEVWNGGLGLFGAVFGGVIGSVVYAKWHHWSRDDWWLFADMAFSIVPGMQAIGRVGNWVNKEIYGLPTNAPWGITIYPGEPKVHPLFFYEMLGLIVLMILLNRHALFQKRGMVTSLYFIGYGCLRFFLEFLRPHQSLVGIFSVAQWVCVGCMIVGVLLIVQRNLLSSKRMLA